MENKLMHYIALLLCEISNQIFTSHSTVNDSILKTTKQKINLIPGRGKFWRKNYRPSLRNLQGWKLVDHKEILDYSTIVAQKYSSC